MIHLWNVLGMFGIAVLATAATGAVAENGARASKADQFRDTESRWQRESTNMPSASPPVSKATPPFDPIPKANTKQQRIERFNAEEKHFQTESTNRPPPSAAVPRSTRAPSPIPKPTTKAQRKAQFAEQERIMQQQSTP